MEFVIVTGLSGAGKSQAIKVMEDIGFYCMDNLPPVLLPKFADLCFQSKRTIDKVAVVVDIRGGKFFDDLFHSLELLEKRGFKYRIIFLDASDEVLIKRFKETRRQHPLSRDGRIIDGIEEERRILKDVKEKSNHLIDTSKLTIGMLKEEIKKIFLEGKEAQNLTISILSFGFKHGLPLDADLVFDVRFLPNPYYIEELKEYTGNDKNVRDYVMNWEQTKTFVDKLIDLIDFLIPYYIKEGKTQLVIAIGCTGGKHRSVTIANVLYETLKDKEHRVVISHRDCK
ncbi:glmZ(sRNA)-inactivating NTPase [Caloranaerobacter sp. TR13]|uniref:RNase adapter RapZ n=1 Tax=Caloranaerobacter sp. TR13 TaxID=1302151 RepID=UPI0006D3D9E8|nr:RNase adapter RapZ [Caloranaerobacter sp. TR13]KPU26955.1 glmZ(sRNA)-inactivating NTPase [Caloranaerobacter sp. TR13]